MKSVEDYENGRRILSSVIQYYTDPDAYGYISRIHQKTVKRQLETAQSLFRKLPASTGKAGTIIAEQWSRDPKIDTFGGAWSGDCTAPPGTKDADDNGENFWGNFGYLEDPGTTILNFSVKGRKKPIGRTYLVPVISNSKRAIVVDSIEITKDFFREYGDSDNVMAPFLELIDTYGKELGMEYNHAVYYQRVSNRTELAEYVNKKHGTSQSLTMKKYGIMDDEKVYLESGVCDGNASVRIREQVG